MLIKRDLYLNKLVNSMNNKMIKVITGIRRSGKSFLLFEIFYNYLLDSGVDDCHIIKFAFDSQEYLDLIGEDIVDISIKKRKVDPKKFVDYIKSKIVDNNSTYYLLLDEIQLLDSFEAVLNGYLRKNNIDIYVTGSNAKFLSKDVITEFAGRGWQIHVNPLSFKEFMQVFKGSLDDGYKEYSIFGGLPQIVEFSNYEDKTKYLRTIIEETYLKDIIIRNKVVNDEELAEVLKFLASSIGSLTNPQRLSNAFDLIKNKKIHADTIKKYIEYFKDSFIISQAQRYNINGRAYISTPLKYYFSDIGLRNVIINFREPEAPRIMENIIYNELINREYSVDVGVVDLYELNSKGKSILKNTEVDFVCTIGDKKYYIQAAYAMETKEKIDQEQRSLLHINDCFKKVIIIKDNILPYYNEKGIYIIGLYDFLMKSDSLDF